MKRLPKLPHLSTMAHASGTLRGSAPQICCCAWLEIYRYRRHLLELAMAGGMQRKDPGVPDRFNDRTVSISKLWSDYGLE